jgi:PAS domain-containing protein
MYLAPRLHFKVSALEVDMTVATSIRFEDRPKEQRALLPVRRRYEAEPRLWDSQDPRVEQHFFHGSVPGFIIGVDLKILDWNPAFDLIFGAELSRGTDLDSWMSKLDNFRNVIKREVQLFGEGLLPMCDRERVVYMSPVWGRMVFTKLMFPITSRRTGRIVGWSISLNINSVSKRVEFFEELFRHLDRVSRRSRYSTSVDLLMPHSPLYRSAVDEVTSRLYGCKKVLIVGAYKSTALVKKLVAMGCRVSVVDEDADPLRVLKNQRELSDVKLVRRHMADLPSYKFDAVILWFPPSFSSEQSASVKGACRVGGLCLKVGYGQGLAVFWEQLRGNIEGHTDLVKYHLNLVKDWECESPRSPMGQGDQAIVIHEM